MRRKAIIKKIFLTAFTFGLIVWLGGGIVRAAVAYDLFVPGTALQLKDWYSDVERVNTIQLYRSGGYYTIYGYGFAFVSAIALCVIYKKQLKKRGWLFMAFVLFFLAAPVEIYLAYLDIKLMLAFNDLAVNHFSDQSVKDYFLYRFENLGIPSALSFLAVATSVLLVIWRPLDDKRKKLEE